MGVSDILKAGGFTPEKSAVGDKPILKGVYKAMFVEGKVNEPNQYGQSYTAKFKITERLSGTESRSSFPEFVGFFAIDDANALSAKKGIKKLINGFFSVGKSVDTSSDEALYASLDALKGSAEVYVSAYKKKAMKQDDSGNWVPNEEAEAKQDFAFLTLANAEREAKKAIAKAGHPL
jgi:hypothetical protein